MFILDWISGREISRIAGKLASLRVKGCLLQPLISLFTNIYKVDMEEACIPEEGFSTFNDFFTRKIREKDRFIDQSPHNIISPADGKIIDTGQVRNFTLFSVKGMQTTVEELLGSKEDAKLFENGDFIAVYLSPGDYHRFHTPFDCEIFKAKAIPGKLYPVNSIGIKYVRKLFSVNERLVTFMKTQNGLCAYVKVGAANVGSITVEYDRDLVSNRENGIIDRIYSPPVFLKKGDLLGKFNIGSTIILLFEEGKIQSIINKNDKVKVGKVIALWK